MDCQQLRGQIESLALRMTDGTLDAEARQHLEACSSCRAELREVQEAWLLQVAALPEEDVSQELEDRVMQRVMVAPAAVREYPPKAVFLKYAVAASVLFLLVSATLFRLGLVGHGQPKVTDRDLEQMRSIARQVAKLNELERVFAAPQLRYVSLRTGPNEPICFFIDDTESEQTHFLGKNLHVAEDSELRLWLLSKDNAVIAKAPIRCEAQTRTGGAVIAPSQSEEVVYAVITRETGGSDPAAPSDAVLFRSEVDLVD